MHKKILITGAAGFIGFHLAKRLANLGIDVSLVDNFRRGVIDDDLNELAALPNVHLFNLDCLSKSAFNDLGINFTHVVHLAAIIGVSHVEDAPYDVMMHNTIMTDNIVEFCLRQRNLNRLLFASTSEVYAGRLEDVGLRFPTPEDTPLTISDLRRPRTSYMLSKIVGEYLVEQSELPVVIFRPHNIYGPRMGLAHVVPSQLRRAYFSNLEENVVVTSPGHTRSYCYISDAVDQLVNLMTDSRCINNVFNLGVEGDEVSVRSLVGLCYKIVGRAVKLIDGPDALGSPLRRNPNMGEYRRLFGNQSSISLEDGLVKTFNWYKKHIFACNGITAQ